MFQQINPNEMPGVGESILNLNRAIWLGGRACSTSPAARIDGANARDPSNTTNLWEPNAANTGVLLPPTMASATSSFPQTLQAGL